jgi:ribosomal protein L11 methyltransferase
VPSAWLQISVRADPSALDAIANFLIEQGSPGVVIKKREVRGYFAQGADADGVRDDVRRYLRAIKTVYPEVDEKGLSWRALKDRNWNKAWQKFFTAQKIGRSFLICPPWLAPPSLKGRHLITIEPGLAFGTGTHATTRGSMEFVERAARLLRGARFHALDVGTGSGILAIALTKSGAQSVWAIDNDPVALKVARENLIANGTARNVRLSSARLHQIRRSFAVVVANLTAETILDLADVLVKKVAPGGFLILSGILRQKARGVLRRFTAGGFRLLGRKREKEWVTLLLRRRN